MEKNISEADWAFLQMFPDPGGPGLPIPRLGKTPLSAEQPQTLPICDEEVDAFTLSWVDEEDLGIRLFVTAARGPQGIEIIASIQGVRPDLFGMAAYVSLNAENFRYHKSRTILLDEWTDEGRVCSGKATFGTADELRNRLGDKVTLDVFLVDYSPGLKPPE